LARAGRASGIASFVNPKFGVSFDEVKVGGTATYSIMIDPSQLPADNIIAGTIWNATNGVITGGSIIFRSEAWMTKVVVGHEGGHTLGVSHSTVLGAMNYQAPADDFSQAEVMMFHAFLRASVGMHDLCNDRGTTSTTASVSGGDVRAHGVIYEYMDYDNK
jgi:hypothetical protein